MNKLETLLAKLPNFKVYIQVEHFDGYVICKTYRYVAILTYRPIRDEIIGSVMTHDVFEKFQKIYEFYGDELKNMALFAWSRDWGQRIGSNCCEYSNIEIIFKYDMHLLDDCKLGHLHAPLYLVRYGRDFKGRGDCGVNYHYYLAGIFEHINKAESILREVKKQGCSDCDILPVQKETAFNDDSIWLGGADYIE